MPSSAGLNGAASEPQDATTRELHVTIKQRDPRAERRQTRDRVIASLLMCPGPKPAGRQS